MANKEKKSAELIRIMATDIPANHSLLFGLSKIKGIGVMFSNAICITLGYDREAGAAFTREARRGAAGGIGR